MYVFKSLRYIDMNAQRKFLEANCLFEIHCRGMSTKFMREKGCRS